MLAGRHATMGRDFLSESAIESATGVLLHPGGLDIEHLQGELGHLLGRSIDYADLYFQYARHEAWSLEDGIVKEGSHSVDQGVGVRAVAGERTGFAYSDVITPEALRAAADAAGAIARRGGEGKVQAWQAPRARLSTAGWIRSRACPTRRRSPVCRRSTRRPAHSIPACARSWPAWPPCMN
jgi:hypothetical protein